MRRLRPIEPKQAAEVEALRAKWRKAADRHRAYQTPASAAAETAAWRAYRDAAYARDPGDPA